MNLHQRRSSLPMRPPPPITTSITVEVIEDGPVDTAMSQSLPRDSYSNIKLKYLSALHVADPKRSAGPGISQQAVYSRTADVVVLGNKATIRNTNPHMLGSNSPPILIPPGAKGGRKTRQTAVAQSVPACTPPKFSPRQWVLPPGADREVRGGRRALDDDEDEDDLDDLLAADSQQLPQGRVRTSAGPTFSTATATATSTINGYKTNGHVYENKTSTGKSSQQQQQLHTRHEDDDEVYINTQQAYPHGHRHHQQQQQYGSSVGGGGSRRGGRSSGELDPLEDDPDYSLGFSPPQSTRNSTTAAAYDQEDEYFEPSLTPKKPEKSLEEYFVSGAM